MSEQDQHDHVVYCIHCHTITGVTEDTMCYVLYGTWYVKCQCGILINLNG